MNHIGVTGSVILRRLPVNNRQDILVDDQELNDIIKAIKNYHNLHKKQYDEISEEFWTGDPHTTTKNLFKFLKHYVRYHVEPEHDQTIKSPGRIIQEGYGDCKHYASFINGVVDSLERKGYPISSCYRFVSDVPGKDVHHVFAVVNTKGRDYWVDPVLSSFDERPNFHNIRDIHLSKGIGRLSYLSGTDAEMGKLNFKKALQNIKKGAQHTTQAVKKGVQHVTHDVKKGVVNTAKKVKSGAVKVAMAPARNAFLALLDINAFNLAKRVTNSSNKQGLLNEWKKLGGDPNKLQQAARNGLLFQAKLHKKGKAVHGTDQCIGMGVTFHSDMITTHPHRWVADHAMRKHRRMRDGYSRTSLVAGSMVGVEPASTATLMTLASAIIAVLAKFLDMKQGEAQAMAAEAARGGSGIMDAAADNADGSAKADRMQAITTPGGGADMSIKTGVDEQGAPQVTIEDVKHPALQNAGTPGGGAGADVIPAGDYSTATDPGGDDGAGNKGFIQDIEDKAKDAWANHKGMILAVAAGLFVLGNKKIRKKIGI